MLKGEENNSFKGDISPPHVCTNNNAQNLNQLRSLEEEYDTLLSPQDKEILSFLEELENKNDISNIHIQSRLNGYFCSNAVFNLSQKVLSDTEINILEDLDYTYIKNKVNEAELRRYFDEFSHKMHLKCYFQNKTTENFSETSSFRCKSSCKPPQGNASLELFLRLLRIILLRPKSS